MLTSLRVINYRCLVDFECKFGPAQLIMGPNGAGKSTIFDVLELLRDVCVRGDALDARLGARTCTRWQKEPLQTFVINVTGNGGSYGLKLIVGSKDESLPLRILREEVTFDDKTIFEFSSGGVQLYDDTFDRKVDYPFDWQRSALATIAERADNKKLSWFKEWLGGLLVVQANPWTMSGIAKRETRSPDRDLSNFADWYRHLRQDSDDSEFFADLRSVIPGFHAMRLEEAGEGRREIKVQMLVPPNARPVEFRIDELSQGQRVLLGLYAILHFVLDRGRTVCIDEPDNFIALGEIQPWLAKALDKKDAEFAPGQLLVISHHPEVLNRLALQSGLLIDREEGSNARARGFADSEQTGLTPSELVVRGWDRG